jgi:RNA polymerase sigma-70 factor, ECF subfamily
MALDAARLAWPTVSLPDDTFIEQLAARTSMEDEILKSLSELHISDIYLACGCLSGSPQALAMFDERFVREVTFGRQYQAAGLESDLRQLLRERALVGQGGLPPKLASYTGRGPLIGWLRVTAARLAVDLRRKQKSEFGISHKPEVPLPALDPELSYLKVRYRAEFEGAIELGFRALAPRELTILRLHYLDNLPAPDIARMYHVSTRTIQRWMVAAQTTVLHTVRQHLRQRLSLSESELVGLLGLVLSQLNVSLHRFLHSPA